MTTVTYTPKRKIFEDNTTFTFDVESYSPVIERNIRETETLSGSVQTALYYLRDDSSVTTIWLVEDDYKRMEEFLYSVSGGEIFQMDSPEDASFLSYKLAANFTKERLSERVDIFKYSFQVKAVNNVT